MILALKVLAALLGIMAVVCVLLLVSLVAAITNAEVDDPLHLDARLVEAPTRLEVTVPAPKRSIRVEHISVSRRLADELGAQPPARFELDSDKPVDPEAFEPDLSLIDDEGLEPTAERVQEFTQQQYSEYLETWEEMDRQWVHFTGKSTIRRGRQGRLSVPLARVAPISGEVMITYSYRVGLVRGMSTASDKVRSASEP